MSGDEEFALKFDGLAVPGPLKVLMVAFCAFFAPILSSIEAIGEVSNDAE